MASFADQFAPFADKMTKEGLGASVIAAFEHSYRELLSGSTGSIPEDSINHVESLPHLENDIRGSIPSNPELLKEVVVVKLNGGLGTSMGLDKAKSLLTVKDENTFLDLTAKQILSMRKKFEKPIQFLLMNSFNTSDDTLKFFDTKYKSVLSEKVEQLELLQNKVPKIDKSTKAPVSWDINSQLEWCPPGHGDLYTALYSSGKLDQLLQDGIKYMFVSNSDNLGATLDLELLSYFAAKDYSFMMECCRRTESDKKGGHLAIRKHDNQFILRESAQCAKADAEEFQNISKHQYFNTNNLWVRLDLLKQIMDAKGGYVPLPTIFNGKTVDPQQDTSTPVWQLETAMGAAIECFANSNAVCVSRERFAPVKKCSDLLLLKSDAYVVNSNNVLVLNPEINAAPVIALDDKKYKLIQQLDMNTRYGIPSLKKCKKLTVIGDVWFNRNVVINGTVTVINNSDEPKMLPPGQYADGSTVDLTDTAPGLGPLRPFSVVTKPYLDQKPGTSGLRKKTKQFEHSEHYLHNFIQSTFNALSTVPIGGVNGTVTDIQNDGALVIGGDGRYFNSTAIQVIIKMAVANGVRHIIVGQDGLLSTPAVSALIRESGPQWRSAFGAFILTASHNPGGPDEDFGIKYNINNGGPAPDVLTNEIFNVSKTITNFKICNNLPTIDLSKTGSMSVTPTSITHSFTTHDANGSPIANTTVTKMSRFECNKNPANVTIDVISSTDIYLKLLQTVFDFKKISGFLKRDDVSFVYDCMHGVQGPYAHEAMQLLVGTYAVRSNCRVMNGIPSETFGGHHADPNLTYARDVCDVMGVDKNGNAQFEGKTIVEPAEVAKLVQENVNVPILGVAADGDADRNMILGRHFFVTPSDSLAIIASHANLIPYFKLQGGLKSVARSMPTSGAIDVVAKHKNYHLFETPTGWKYFGNVMDSKKLFQGMNYNPVLCGEESFGTGSDHVREKDGLWAVLSWLSILAHFNSDANKPLVHVRDIVLDHWKAFGRNYYSRYDYEGVTSDNAALLMKTMINDIESGKYVAGQKFGEFELAKAEEFTYTDPIDGSVARNQGIIFLFTDNSRIIFRLSGTSGSGATIRMYMEKYQAPTGHDSVLLYETKNALESIVKIALEISQIVKFTGMESPTVIT